MPRPEAETLVARAPVVRVASTTASGEPVLRTVHGVVVRGGVAWHGAPAGEKMETVGRAAVVAAEELVATVPSYFLDPERACPATTLYRSVEIHGAIEAVDDPAHKAEVLQALMEKLQPEGGHVPITATNPLYAKAVEGILILRVPLERLDGKAKLAQNRTPAERARLLAKLWERGQAGRSRGHRTDPRRQPRHPRARVPRRARRRLAHLRARRRGRGGRRRSADRRVLERRHEPRRPRPRAPRIARLGGRA